jgi:regulator of ribonuclease activity A
MTDTTTTADLWDERGDELQSLSLPLIDFGGVVRFSGAARTVRCFEDNALLKSMVSTRGDGAVLVVDGGGSARTALMGDMIAATALENGWAGVVINGAVRDRAALSTLPLGIKALASNPRKSSKTGAGEADVVLTIEDVVITPGCRVYADEDGVLVERPETRG